MAIITLGNQEKWRLENMEQKRYEYSIKPEEIVYDIGAYEGEFSWKIYKLYGCHIVAFEPGETIKGFSDITPPFVYVVNAAAWIFDGKIELGGEHNWIGLHEKDHLSEYECSDINIILRQEPKVIALMKINIEGGEYDILPHIIKAGLHERIRNIQVQFHYVEARGSEAKYKIISDELKKTHKLTWREPFVWENWERK